METIIILLSVFGSVIIIAFIKAFIKVYIKKEQSDFWLEKYSAKVEIQHKIEELKKKAAISNKINFQSNSSNVQETSLSRVIKSKEAGDLFMKRLKAL